MTERPFRDLCPEADERDAMSDAEFWHRVAENLGAVSESEPDWDYPDLDVQMRVEPCPECESVGACAWDAEGRPLIHVSERGDE